MGVDLVATLEAGKTLSSFVEGGPLGEALSSAGLRAARDALEKVPEAKARRQQVWSAVNHVCGGSGRLLRAEGAHVFSDARLGEIEDAIFAMPRGTMPAQLPGPEPR